MPALFDRRSLPQRIAILFFVVAAMALAVGEGFSAETVPTGVGLVLCAALPVIALLTDSVRLAAVLAVGGASVAFTAYVLLAHARPDNTFGVVELAGLLCVVVRVVVQYRPLRAAGATAALGLAVLLLPLRIEELENEYRGAMMALLALGTAFLVLLGLYLRLHDRRRADGFELARQAQRLAYARDLHDFVAHHVTGMVTQTKAVRYLTAAGTPPEPADLDTMLAGIERAGSQALTSMRSMVTTLRDDNPVHDQDKRTLGEVVTAAVDGFSPTGPAATTALDPALAGARLPALVLDAAQHVVQESLTNVLRHADGATEVEVAARPGSDGLVELTITDDGTPAEQGTEGHGLVGLTERVSAVGGTLAAGPVARGWQVTALLPVKGSSAP
ncbi:sensor histidine kinase [Amycolatopsis minnesotensis]